MTLRERVTESIHGLERWLAGYGDKGYDPYDALNSPVLRMLSLGRKWPRIALTQAMRRFPVNLRPLLGVPRTYNPKGLGLFLSGTIRRYRLTGDERYASRARALAARLVELCSDGFHGACWGYPFPWQSRAFYLPRWTPTIVNTAFVAHALLDAADALHEDSYAHLARSSCEFILKDLQRTEFGEGLCFSYTPFDSQTVHNANMLGAGLLARVGARHGEEPLKATARRCARYLLDCQRPDGSWWYAEPEFQNWIDSFHTGFCLEALRLVVRHAGMAEAAEALERGHLFFIRNFFERDGTPRYFHDRRGPLDLHCPTQGFVTMTELSDVMDATALLERSARWFLDRMRAPEGYFYFRIGNRIPYLRWGQAWAYHGLTRLQQFLAPADSSADSSREGTLRRVPEETA